MTSRHLQSDTAFHPLVYGNDPMVIRKTGAPPASSRIRRTRRTMTPSLFAASASFSALYKLEVLDAIRVVKAGVPARFLVRIINDMALPKHYVLQILGLSLSTTKRKIECNATLNLSESERVLWLGRLIGRVQYMVEESGEPRGFDAAKWVARWIKTPKRHLGGKRPDELFDTADGRELVSNLIALQQSGAYG